MTTNQERRDRGFAALVDRAVGEVLAEDGRVDRANSGAVAGRIVAAMRADGFAIHDTANCVRKPWQDRAGRAVRPDSTLGREMTPDEQIRLGVVVPSADVPD
jgi:hypothetical protein